MTIILKEILTECIAAKMNVHDIEVTSDFQCNEKPVKGTVKWSHIEAFYQLDKTNPNLVYAPQLTDNHLRPNCQQKMRVKLAAQVFSHSVTTGMLMKIAQNELPAEAHVTATFVQKFDELLNQLRNEAGGSGDSTLDTSSPPSEAYLTANDSSKYFSMLEDESSFNISKDAVNPATEAEVTDDNPMISNLSPISKKGDMASYKIGKQIEAANILSGGVNIFDDNDNSFDGDELVIDDNVAEADEKSNTVLKLTEDTALPYDKVNDNLATVIDDSDPAIPSKDTEVVLQIDGKNVNAIAIGNGLYLYRKEGQEELAAVQIIDDNQQQSSFKFLKVRENAEGNLEVYEEIEIEVPKEVPSKVGKSAENISHVPLKDINKVISEPAKIAEKNLKTPQKGGLTSETNTDLSKDSHSQFESKTEVNFNGKVMKFSEARKSPVVGSFTPMTFHSTPNKEGIPLTKTMVDQQLHPNRHSDNIKKTIEVHTDSSKFKNLETPVKINKDISDFIQTSETVNIEKESKLVTEEESMGEQKQTDKFSAQDGHHDNKSLKIKELSKGKCKIEEDVTKPEVDSKVTQLITVNQTEKTVTNEVDGLKNQTSDSAKTYVLINNEKYQTDGTKNIVSKQDIKVLESSETVTNEYNTEKSLSNDLTAQGNNTENKNCAQQCANNPIKSIACKKEEAKQEHEAKIMHEKENLMEALDESNFNQDTTAQHIIKNMHSGIRPIKSETDCTEISNCLNTKNIANIGQHAEIESTNTTQDLNAIQQTKTTETVEVTNNVVHNIIDTSNVISENHDKKNVNTGTRKLNLIIHESQNNDVMSINKSIKISPNNDAITKSKDLVINSNNIQNSLNSNVVKDEKHSIMCQKEKSETSQISCKLQPNKKDESTQLNKVVAAPKPLNNNHAAVPFGKWTEANRQEFLNKIKETKVPTNHSNTKQLKQPNDLNRRDILQKIDSQRQQQTHNAKVKVQEQQKLNINNEASAFVKASIKHDTKIPIRERPTSKTKPICNKKNTKDELLQNQESEPSNLLSNSSILKKESSQRTEINNQALIDKTIEDIINRVPPVKTSNEDSKPNIINTDGIEKQKGMTLFGPSYHAKNEQSVTLDDIEMKMNELHGIPFVERPAHELPQKLTADNQIQPQKTENQKSNQKNFNASNQEQFAKNSQQVCSEIVNMDSDDEIIEHEPITGDIDTGKKTSDAIENVPDQAKILDESKKDVIITEKDFDKFFRGKSVTYENCLTVNFDSKEPHNVVQTAVEKEIPQKKLTRNEVLLAESKAKSTHKQQLIQARLNHPTKIPTSGKYQTAEDESYGKNYQSKLQIAYQSALTAKRQKDCPITIIEEKPVKVVFMDSNTDFVPCQLNVHGENLSPTKQTIPDLDTFTHSTTDSLDSDIFDNFDSKSQDESKTKSKHQRKQVLTPVETSEMELIEPSDLGIEISPKKKRKIEDKIEKSPRNHVPKKSYLLGRAATDDSTKTQNVSKTSFKEITNENSPYVGQSNPISAIDNLVKAAELLENQAENIISSINTPDSDSQQNTPVKRGRGRPRKYPLPDGEVNKIKAPSPQKKPRLIDAKVIKREDTDVDDSSDDGIIKENWTMGPSPNRSESDKRSFRESQESETRSNESKSDDMDIEEQEVRTPKKKESKESILKVPTNSDEVIIIEDTPLKEKPGKHHESRKSTVKTKVIHIPSKNLICEICGKTFRQSSYLAHHKLQHKNEESKKHESVVNKSVFSCEVCKKVFRKLHHLVQHRIIHNPHSVSSRMLRKTSSEHSENKVVKSQSGVKQTEDQSAGFRCEPCDKSFRKLHHLVEHRETHDGINRQKASEIDINKPTLIHQCDICDKTFKKLQLLNEHKEQHLDTCSEKSDDKSVKSSLSTKDIIHECSLCYMVFPNEYSLNKHTVICLRKKKQSAAKAKLAAENKESEIEKIDSETPKPEKCNPNITEDSLIIVEDDSSTFKDVNVKEDKLKEDKPEILENPEVMHIIKLSGEQNIVEPQIKNGESFKSKEKTPVKTVMGLNINTDTIPPSEIPIKSKQIDEDAMSKTQKTPVVKKITPAKDKVFPTVTKREKIVNVPLPVIDEATPSAESIDEDEIRYMLNPNFKQIETVGTKNLLKVKAKIRNSLQVERPNSKDLVKRRVSLQNLPKISRLRNKPLEQKLTAPSTSTASKSTIVKIDKPTVTESTFSTDSDDSDIKYSFPETVTKHVDTKIIVEKKPMKRQSLSSKRKSLNGVAKRKALGQVIVSKHKQNTPPAKQVKKRTTEVEHRCDCGQLFSSAALLSRHTTLDHTPPRIRRRRSPVPVIDTKTITKKVSHKPISEKLKPNTDLKKSSGQGSTDSSKPGVATRKSSMNNSDDKASSEKGKLVKSVPSVKLRRSAAHKGVPLPEKMRKLMDKPKI
ncbi:unnamed protein product [Parnassius apollo]|uniref:(apollo) hypothetical protein n=1 Tax=Parnassius apollo TaxID=110799 RepID=A0A8S3Y0G7_PARAO|nr:unnamed protein product [Parnassius apollo]